jgi:hypothetical protein
VYDQAWWTPDLWILDLARGTKTRFTFGPGSFSAPVWQADGLAVIYGNNTAGTGHIYRKELNGKNPEVLLETAAGIFAFTKETTGKNRSLDSAAFRRPQALPLSAVPVRYLRAGIFSRLQMGSVSLGRPRATRSLCHQLSRRRADIPCFHGRRESLNWRADGKGMFSLIPGLRTSWR